MKMNIFKGEYKEDVQLIFDVERKQTGANIHTVSSYLALYGSSIDLYNRKVKQDYYIKEIKRYEEILKQFLITGKFPKSPW